MNKLLKNILRGNKYIEILAYIVQNNRFLNSSGTGEFDNDINGTYNHCKNVSNLYIDKYPGSLANKIVLEIGTGYSTATMLYMIKYKKLDKAYCYDRFNCLSRNNLEILTKYELDRYQNKLEYLSGKPSILAELLPENSIDYIVSNAVLEHVDNLDELFEILSGLLKADGKMYHKVDLRCHNRFKNHGELYFHIFSNKLWKMMGGNIGQPNRKLLHEYKEIFDSLGLKYDVKILECFNEYELSSARHYLSVKNIDKYRPSIVEFIIYK